MTWPASQQDTPTFNYGTAVPGMPPAPADTQSWVRRHDEYDDTDSHD